MVKLKRNMLSVALMSATMIMVGNAHAQSQQEEETRDKISKEEGKEESNPDAAKEIDKVVVTGLRSAIENSIETKRDNSQIVESVSAEDVGKLPDNSIADALARLPGVTAQRTRGRATQIQIRGFAGDFATTLLNGREQASTGDNRAAEFDQYPSELLSQVVVYKTADASLVGQGLSGTVDLQTVNPLSFDDRQVSLSYRYDQNELNGDNESGNRFAFTYIDQFLDNTLGISIGYAYQDSPQPGLQNEAWGYNCNGPTLPNSGTCANASDSYYRGGGKVYKFDADFKRQGWAGSIQFKPNDFYETSFDAFYSTFDKTEIKTGLEFSTGNPLPGFTVGGNNTITNFDSLGISPVIRNDSNPQENTTQSYGWNNIFTFNENWKMIVDLATSKAESSFTYLETYGGLRGAVPGTVGSTGLNTDFAGDYYDFTFGTDLGNPNNLQLIDAGGWGQDGYVKYFNVEDTLDSYRVDFIRSFTDGAISSIEFGVNYTDRSKSKSSDEYFLCINPLPGQCGNRNGYADYPGSSQPFNFSGIENLAAFNAEQLLADGTYTLRGNENKDIAQKNWTVDEQLTTWYGQFNLDTQFGNVRMTGNIGVQIVQTDQSSNGYSTFDGNPAGVANSGGATYSNLLPSLNLNFNVFENQFLRVAVAQQQARPRMDALRSSIEVVATQDQDNDPNVVRYQCQGVTLAVPIWCGYAGNPELKPWLATAYDLSYEWYFDTENDNKGYLSAAYFYKNLDTYIYYQNQEYNFANTPLPPAGPGIPVNAVGIINKPVNGEGGYMKGYELTASLPLDALWNPLEGFGLLATYAANKSNISPPDNQGNPVNQPIPGLSEEVYNASLYWERFGWQIRYNYRYRSAYRGETRGFGADLTVIDISAETVQDAQIQYTFGSGFMENFTLYLQVNNLGDEPFRSDAGENRPINYFEYGRQTLLGFSYKF